MQEPVTRTDLTLAIHHLKDALTIRLSSIIVAGVAALAILGLFH